MSSQVRPGTWSTSFEGKPAVQQWIHPQQSFLWSSRPVAAPSPHPIAQVPKGGGPAGSRHRRSEGGRMKTGWRGKEWGPSSFPPALFPGCWQPGSGPPRQEDGGAVSGKLTQEQADTDVGSPQKSSRVPLQFTVTSSFMHTAPKKPFKLPS